MRLLLAFLLFPLGAQAEINLPLPSGAVETASEETTGRYALPNGRYTPDRQPAKVLDGQILTKSWRTPLEQADTLNVATALREEMAKQDFRLLYECQSSTCGGFDFRFNLPILPQPAMEVDLQDFYYIAGVTNSLPSVHVGILISQSEQAGYIQITQVTESDIPDVNLSIPEAALVIADSGGMAASLRINGRAVLADVQFSSGSTTLTKSSLPAIEALAALLESEPELVLLIVGHSDNQGGLEANIKLSKARAEAVRENLISLHGVSPDRLEAWGAGYIAPLVPNDSDENQALNRRVEIVVK